MSHETISLERRGAVLIVTLDRSDRLNACSLAMADELRAALNDTGDARAVMLTGAGRAFCSGADLLAGAGAHGSPGDATHAALVDHYNPLMIALARHPLPIVAAVNGPAAGIGSSIALACDFVVAADDAYFLQAFVNIGLIPDGGASWLLPRLVGKARATELMMLGERLQAQTAAQWGLIHRCVAAAELFDEAFGLARRLAALPTLALGIMRANLHAAMAGSFDATLAAEADGQRRAANSADAAIGTAAFIARQTPQFIGK